MGLLAATTTPGLAEGDLLRSLFAIVAVFGLLGVLAWAVKRGRLGPLQRRGGLLAIEATVPLGERRALMVVAVEGRRLLLGLTPAQVTLVTELRPAPPAKFDAALERATTPVIPS